MHPDASPTARALLALELIQSTPGITADRLGARLGVTERAARRYVGILREAGIPIDSVRGPYGGYRVGRGLRLPPMVFSATEALGLVMAALDGHHAASDPTDPVGRALGKLIRALPEPVAAHAETVRRTTAPAPDRAAARPDPDTTAALVAACSSHRTVRLDYRTEAGSEWVVDIEPWTVVVRHGRWYVVGRSLQHGQTRTYRIDRVRRVDLLVADLPASRRPGPGRAARGAPRGRVGVRRRMSTSPRRSTWQAVGCRARSAISSSSMTMRRAWSAARATRRGTCSSSPSSPCRTGSAAVPSFAPPPPRSPGA